MLAPVQFLFNENINIYLQSFGNRYIDIFFKVVTDAGSEPVYIFLASLMFWCYSKKIGIRAMYVILFSSLAAIFAKNLLGMPRPPAYLYKIPETGFGFPSGHALVSAGFWGYLGSKIKNQFFVFAGALAILLVSLSRIYLGVHYAGDVVGGIFFGLLLALIFFKAEQAVVLVLRGRRSKYLVAVIIPLILMLTAMMQRSLVGEQVEIGIVMASISIGYLLEEERITLEDAKNNEQRIKRAIAGIFLLAVIYSISHFLFSDYIFFKYPALGLTSTFLAPWVFTRMESASKNI